MERLDFRAMGSQMAALLDTRPDRAADRLAQVPGWFAVWEQRLSRFRADSELSQLNRRPGEPVRLSPVLWDVLQASLQAAERTQGLVVPTLLPALESAGYDRDFESLRQNPPAASRSPHPEAGDWRALRLDPGGRTVTLPPDVRLDLGGVAKGWAADRAARRLGASAAALIDAGGDIAVSGPPSGGPGWSIGVADPKGSPEAQVEVLRLARGGVATSGRDYRRWEQEGSWMHHILDPRTALPAHTDVLSATVVAPTATEAEAAAKAALILGSQEGLAWIDDRPALAGLLVLEDGQVLRSRRLKRYLWSQVCLRD
jgi:thiamine biosynthesis lipoprotein